MPGRRYCLHTLVTFILHLLSALTVTRAYQFATGALTASRHAWRWVKDLFARLSYFRSVLTKQARGENSCFCLPRRLCRRLRIVLPTLEQLGRVCAFADIQLQQQQAMTLIIRCAEGNLRLCRNLCYASLIEAARETRKIVTITHVNNVLVQPHRPALRWRSHEELIKQQVA